MLKGILGGIIDTSLLRKAMQFCAAVDTYWVATADDEPGRNGGGEKRASSREQTRLRSAKLLDAAYRFLCECRICDHSRHGLRLALGRNIRLPRRMAVHIDETGEVR